MKDLPLTNASAESRSGESGRTDGAARLAAPAAHSHSLLHYRPWRGELRGSSAAGVLLFVAVQACLLGLIAAPEYPVMRLVLAGVFVGMWGLVVRSRAWPIARVALGQLFRRRLFWA